MLKGTLKKVAHKNLVFQPIQRYFKIIDGVGDSSYICYWKSKGLSDEKINSITTSLHKISVKFNGGCLKQDRPTFLHGGIVNVYTVYEPTNNDNVSSYPTLENCLFGAVKLTKNADTDKYWYFNYGIGFDRHGYFSHPSGGTGGNVIILGVDMSSSTKIYNKKKDILILGKGPTRGLGHTLSAEKIQSINFTEKKKKNCLSLHYNKENSYLFVNGT